MAMVVQHNLTAMNANRQLGITTGAQAKSSEKLSSGYRINRAGDDAAGLKISEKMRSQIRGLDKASDNAQDGISLIQTAEGALNEAHSILQRMNELAVQGANDTNQSIDRDAINQELEALTDELDRISETTQFNKQNLLDGNFKDKKLQVGRKEGDCKADRSGKSRRGTSCTLRCLNPCKRKAHSHRNIKGCPGKTGIFQAAGSIVCTFQRHHSDSVSDKGKCRRVSRLDTSGSAFLWGQIPGPDRGSGRACLRRSGKPVRAK